MTIPLWVPCEELSLMGPNSKEELNRSYQEDHSRSFEERAPIYSPPSKAGSVADRSSMAGLRRPPDDTCDINDSLTYRPDSTKRSEVPKVRRKVDEYESGGEEDPGGRRERPSMKVSSDRAKPHQRSPKKEQRHVQKRSPLPVQDRSAPAVQNMPLVPQQRDTSPPASRERPLRDRSKSPPRNARPEVQQRTQGRSPSMPRSTPPPPISTLEHSSPTRSPASTNRGMQSDLDRSEENLSTSESLKDSNYKITTV